MASATAGPARRNFGGNGPSSSKRKNGNVVRIFFLVLITLVVVLAAAAYHLSRRLMQQQQQHHQHSPPSSSRRRSRSRNKHSHHMDHKDAPKKTASSGTETAAAAVVTVPPETNIISTDNNGKDRVYCMIPFIWNAEIHSAIMDTWGKRCDVINFLTDSIVGGQLKGDKIIEGEGYKPYWEYPEGTFPENVHFINMTRTWNDCPEDKKGVKKVCRHIWEKMWRSWVYVDDNHLNQAEWFCKVDYDTFFFPSNVKHYVRHKNWNPYNEHHYFGHLIQHRQKGRENMIVGAAACWSQKTLHGIAEVYRQMPKGATTGERGKCEDRAQATEEATTSLCLNKYLNVTAYPARDDELRETIVVAKYTDVLTWNRTKQGEWWYWKGKPKGAGEGENAIAVRPIGLHKYKLPEEIREVNNQFYGPPEVLNKMKLRTKTYVSKVRKAIGVDP